MPLSPQVLFANLDISDYTKFDMVYMHASEKSKTKNQKVDLFADSFKRNEYQTEGRT